MNAKLILGCEIGCFSLSVKKIASSFWNKKDGVVSRMSCAGRVVAGHQQFARMSFTDSVGATAWPEEYETTRGRCEDYEENTNQC